MSYRTCAYVIGMGRGPKPFAAPSPVAAAAWQSPLWLVIMSIVNHISFAAFGRMYLCLAD